MSITREVPRKEWEAFLPALVEQSVGNPVRLETEVSAGEGEPVLADGQPLLAIDVDRKGSDAPAITVAVGGLEAGEPSLTHVIEHPTHLWVKEEPAGQAQAVEIESDEEGRTLLVFLQ